ncbi:hypothetical protein ARALYDRAFT_338394 [Arabidopsis lyrata subsp. lyrata]|uniref:Uncharacterized protein n=1 Tax=Arabidopsis lyrata subsp. lyrata TaxID=81972 RepID=D7KXQ9_ARALL|nr:hypothetical protein ARALYDRAFT_338394 [Arabidopsis lyrata subsp. lyrata]
MQQNSVDSISVVEHSLENTILVDVENLHLDDVSVGGDDNADEFDDSDNSKQGFSKLCKQSGDQEAPVIFLKHNVVDEYDEQSEVAERLRIKINKSEIEHG